MTNHRSIAAWLFLSLALIAVAAGAQSIPVEAEIGYRFTDVNGNEDLYRTQINERDGFLIHSLSFFATPSPGGPFDQFRVDIADLGSGPASALSIRTGRHEAWNFRLGYRRFESFSALPAFANPLLGAGIVPGQHTYDRDRTMLDMDLELMPGRKFTPFIGYTYGRNEGPGTSTYTIGGDDFLLDSNLRETDQEFRVGAGFNTAMFYGSVTQGWRRLRGTDDLTLHAGAGGGNNPGPILGHPVSAVGITRHSRTDVDSPFTNLYVTGQFVPKLRVIANYTHLSASADGPEDESATGSFASFALGRFFGGVNEHVTSEADNRTWRGGARAEYDITNTIAAEAGWQKEHRKLTGTSLIESIFTDTLTFGGVDPRTIQESLSTDNSLERDEDVLSAALSARAVGPFSARAAFSQTKQSTDLTPDLEEIVVPGNQGGSFDRRINTLDLSANFAQPLFSIGAAWRTDDANDPVLRTDFLNRDRIRARAAFHTPGSLFRAGLTAERTTADNNREGIGYDAKARQYTADAEVAPMSALRLRASYSKLRADSEITIRRPQSFDLDTSVQKEDGRAVEGGIALLFSPVTFDASYSRFKNEGTLPFDVDRYRTRLAWDFLPHLGAAAEWSRDKYDENASWGQFDADRYGIFLRFR